MRGFRSLSAVAVVLGVTAARPAAAEQPNATPQPADAPAAPPPVDDLAPASDDAPALGADVFEEPLAQPPVEIHAFVSQGALWTTANNYLAHTEHGSLEFAEAGVNVTKQLSDRLRAGLQLFARDLGPIGDFDVKLDWFYVDYHWRDYLGLRVGRVKLPFGLYNETYDVDAAHTFALLPQSVYPAVSREFLLAQSGVELYGIRDLGRGGALDYRLYGGTIFQEVTPAVGSPVQVAELDVPYLVGGRVLWEPPVASLRLGGSLQTQRVESQLRVDVPPMPLRVEVDTTVIQWMASVEYTPGDLALAAEYGRWHVDLDSSDPTIHPEAETTSERGYLMAAYRPRPWLQPGAYYSIYYPNVAKRDGNAAKQHDVAATVRFDVSPNWIVKLEGHFMRGTAALSSSLNGGTPRDELAHQWGLLVAKVTAYF